jgi:hypothetical protein
MHFWPPKFLNCAILAPILSIVQFWPSTFSPFCISWPLISILTILTKKLLMWQFFSHAWLLLAMWGFFFLKKMSLFIKKEKTLLLINYFGYEEWKTNPKLYPSFLFSNATSPNFYSSKNSNNNLTLSLLPLLTQPHPFQ